MPNEHGEQLAYVPSKGFVPKDELTPDDLAAIENARWSLKESLKGLSQAKRPQVETSISLAGLERLILDDDQIGPNQRATMLKVVRWLDKYAADRYEGAGEPPPGYAFVRDEDGKPATWPSGEPVLRRSLAARKPEDLRKRRPRSR